MIRVRFLVFVSGVFLVLFAGPTNGENAKPPRTDLYGDPLPPGTVARLGTIRLRHANSEIAFSKDGRQMISCDSKGTVRVWDVATGKLRKEMRLSWTPKLTRVAGVVLSPDGATVAKGDNDEIRLYAVDNGKERGCLSCNTRIHFLEAQAFSPDGKRFASRIPGEKREILIHLWDVNAREISQILKVRSEKSLSNLVISWDNRRLAGIATKNKGLGGVDYDLFLWDTLTGKLVAQIKDLNHLSETALSFSPDGKSLAVGDRSKEGVRLLDSKTLKQKEVLKRPAEVGVSDFVHLAYSPDGRFLAASYSNSLHRSPPTGGVLLWDLSGEKSARLLTKRYTSAMRFAPNSKTLACREGAEIRLYDVASGRPLHDWPGHNKKELTLAVSADGKVLASGDSDGVLRLWDTATSRQLWRREGDGFQVAACSFSANGKRLVSVSKADPALLHSMALAFIYETAACQVWEVASGKALRRIELNIEREGFLLNAPAIAADGKWLATVASSDDGSTLPPRRIVWDLATGKRRIQRRHKIDKRESAFSPFNRPWMVGHMAFTPDGERATVWLGDRVGIEEVSTGCLLAMLPKGVDGPLGFSLDGRLLAALRLPPRESPDEDENAKDLCLIESASGEEILRLKPMKFDALAFTSDGRGIILADRKGLSVWDLETGAKLHRMEWPTGGAGTWSGKSLAALPGGRVATGRTEGDILIWDLAPSKWPVRKEEAEELDAKQLDALWSDLAKDARTAHRAIFRMAAAPARTVPFLKGHLRSATVDAKRIEKLLADLNGDSFAARRAATQELARLHYRIEPMLRKALQGKPSLEMRRRIEFILAGPKKPLAEDLRRLRARAVLERIGRLKEVSTPRESYDEPHPEPLS